MSYGHLDEDLTHLVEGASGDLPASGDYEHSSHRTLSMIDKMTHLHPMQLKHLRWHLCEPVKITGMMHYHLNNIYNVWDFFNHFEAEEIRNIVWYIVALAGLGKSQYSKKKNRSVFYFSWRYMKWHNAMHIHDLRVEGTIDRTNRLYFVNKVTTE